jgi:hypothetical protein
MIVIDAAAGTITVPQAGAARFYRIRQAPPAPTITNIKISGTTVMITYR